MNCYVADPNSGYELPKGVNKENTLFWPEQGMSTRERHATARPATFHILTDSVDLVGLYKEEEVFVWDGKEWSNPDMQTYGASHNLIRARIFGIRETIPLAVLNGKVTNCMGSPLT